MLFFPPFVLRSRQTQWHECWDSRGTCAEVILGAEGFRTQAIQLAKGEAEAKLMKSKAEADSIGYLRAALDKLGFTKR